MDSSLVQRRPSLSSQVLGLLIDKIREGAYPPENPLPSENTLAAEFKVSRATIRSAFDRLETMGLIYRRQGIGTFTRQLSKISNPLNQFVDFYSLIKDNGHEPDFKQLSAKIVEPPAGVAKDLQLNPGQRTLEVHKVFFADKIPIIFCVNFIPEWVFEGLFTPEEILQPDLIEPYFLKFFKERCRQSFKYFICSVQAGVAGNAPALGSFARFDPNTSILIIDEVGYNEDDRPILQSVEYHPGNWMKFKLIRSP